MPVEQVPGYLGRVPSYVKLAAQFLALDPKAFADWMLADLERAGAVAIDDGLVLPTMAA
jgi:hypothetical protein